MTALTAAIIYATCAQLPALVRDTSTGAPADATIVLTTDCPAGAPLRIGPRARPLTIEAGERRVFSLWGNNLGPDFTWRGGVIEAVSGHDRTNARLRRAVQFDGGCINLEGATIQNAFQGFVPVRPTCPIRVRHNRFQNIRGDGLNIIGDNALPPVSAVVEGNSFTDFRPQRSTCTYPDGRVEISVPRAGCTKAGGVWVDGDHPDCIQMWGKLGRVEVRFNRIDTLVEGDPLASCMGITSFGQPGDTYETIVVEHNTVRTADLNGIAIGDCLKGCVIRWNRVQGPDAYIRTYGTFDGAVCGNSVETTHPARRAQSGLEACGK